MTFDCHCERSVAIQLRGLLMQLSAASALSSVFQGSTRLKA